MSDSATVPVEGKGVLTGEDNPVSRVQTDLFCDACGLNLHGRAVWRTEEGGLLVARCDCGKVFSAGIAVPGREVWRRRLGITLALIWIGAMVFGLAGLAIGEYVFLDEAIPNASYTWVSGTGVVPMSWEVSEEWAWNDLRFMAPVAGLVMMLGGAMLSCLLYHWRRFWHVAVMIVLPPAMLTLWMVEVLLEPGYYMLRLQGLGLSCALITMGAMLVGGVVGVLIGRPVGRGLLRVLLPNRPRQLFAFLWRRDGKEMPVGPY